MTERGIKSIYTAGKRMGNFWRKFSE